MGQEESVTNCKFVTPRRRLFFLPVDKLQRRSAGLAEGLIAETDLLVHDAGHKVLTTAAGVEKRSWDDSGWLSLVIVTA